ncbi:MAG: SH3 domain-containing protein [Flavobacteriales bacterium]
MKTNGLLLFLVTFILVLGLSLDSAASTVLDKTAADSLSAQAQRAYASGDYERALHLFDSVRVDYTSPSLLLNIGNCHFKMGDVPRAILNYERGLRLAPGDEDMQANLDLAREQVKDRVNQLPAFALGSTWGRMRGGSDMDQWARRTLWVGLVFFLLLAAGFTMRQRWMRRSMLGASGAALIALVICIAFAGTRHAEIIDDSEAIILAPKVDVSSEPRAGSTTLFVLHKGTKVSVLQEQNGWYEVKLPNGSVGWMPPATLERI